MKPRIQPLCERKKDAYYEAAAFCRTLAETGELKTVQFSPQIGHDKPMICVYAEVLIDANTIWRLREIERILIAEGTNDKT